MKILFVLFMMLPSLARAVDSHKCSDMMNDGLYKKYKWQGYGESNLNAITAETKSSGSSTASSKISTEASTAAFDPKHTTNVTTSQGQATSSTGPCSLFALLERRDQREQYIAQNFAQVRKDFANGRGEHLKALAWFSLCDDGSESVLASTLQKHFSELDSGSAELVALEIDGLISQSESLAKACFQLGVRGEQVMAEVIAPAPSNWADSRVPTTRR